MPQIRVHDLKHTIGRSLRSIRPSFDTLEAASGTTGQPDTHRACLRVPFQITRPTDVWRERGWYDRDVHGPHRQALGYALSTIRRTAEATALRVLITKLTKNTATPVVVIGDINDGQHSNTMNVLTEQPQYLGPLSRGGGDISLYTVQTL